jgi:hypothetical protein
MKIFEVSIINALKFCVLLRSQICLVAITAMAMVYFQVIGGGGWIFGVWLDILSKRAEY